MDLLSRFGLYLDGQDELRIIDPDTLEQSVRIRDQLKQLMPAITNFHEQLRGFIQVMMDIEKITDNVRLRALASRNNAATDQSGGTNQRIDQAMRDLIVEKSLTLERLNAELVITSNLIEEQQQLIRCLEASM